MQNVDISVTSAGRRRTPAARDASGCATWPPAVVCSLATRWRNHACTRAGSCQRPATWRAVAGSRPSADARTGPAGRPAGTCGAPGLVARRRLPGWPRFARGFFLFSSGSATQALVQGRFDPLETGFRSVLSSTASRAVQSTVHVCPLPRGGRFGPRKRESSPRRRGGPPLSQVSSLETALLTSTHTREELWRREMLPLL
jgi:hypothetical protein